MKYVKFIPSRLNYLVTIPVDYNQVYTVLEEVTFSGSGTIFLKLKEVPRTLVPSRWVQEVTKPTHERWIIGAIYRNNSQTNNRVVKLLHKINHKHTGGETLFLTFRSSTTVYTLRENECRRMTLESIPVLAYNPKQQSKYEDEDDV